MAEKATNSLQTKHLENNVRVTILEAFANKNLVKRFHSAGCDTYSLAKHFKHEEVPIEGFGDLAALLSELERSPSKMIVMGSVIDAFRDHPRIMRRSRSKGTEHATLEDTGSYLLHFDYIPERNLVPIGVEKLLRV